MIGNTDGHVFVVDLVTGKLLGEMGKSQQHPYIVSLVAISRNLVASSSNPTIKVWNIDKFTLEYTLQGHTMCIPALVCNLEKQILISGSEDETIRVWNDTEAVQVISTNRRLSSLSLVNGWDGILVSGGWKKSHRNSEEDSESNAEDVIQIWNYISGEILQTISSNVGVMSICPLGDDSFAVGNEVHI